MNKQEMFNLIFCQALKQGERSLRNLQDDPLQGNSDSCAYRGLNGKRCFIGFIIPDELYSPAYEKHSVCELFEMSGELSDLLTPSDMSTYDAVNFLSQLQGIHDSTSPEIWEENLEKLAAQHDLEVPTC